ncbi:MAG TPA: helix-turn-helix transcriptional regulator [Stellaceae bacterium]|jgi:DNA-binding CsgD family transcriptional regulator
MPQNRKILPQNESNQGDSDSLGTFLIDRHCFKIVSVDKDAHLPDRSNTIREVVRFRVEGRIVAIIEEARPPDIEGETKKMISRLTSRELQIAAMIAQGNATKNVAYKLRISEWTVGTHLRRIFAKLGVDNRAAMVYRCASLIENTPPAEPRNPSTRAPAD